MRKLLITGAAGLIATEFLRRYGGGYDLRLADCRPAPEGLPGACEWLTGDLAEPGFAARAAQGMDLVLHLAANASVGASFIRLLPANIVAAYNVFEESCRAGVKRLVFASSIHAALSCPPQEFIRDGEPALPATLYGASKCWGEALCSVYSQKGMSCLAIRIGAFLQKDHLECASEEMRRHFVSHDDLCDLLRLALEADSGLMYGVFHGVGNNAGARLDITGAAQTLGYSPRDGAK